MDFKTIGKSFLIAIVTYVVLLFAFDSLALDKFYQQKVVDFANRFHHKYTKDGNVDFEIKQQISKSKSQIDVIYVKIQSQKVLRMMEAEARKRGLTKIDVPRAEYFFEIKEFAITPLILLLILIIASPVGWQRKLKALGIGLVVFHLFLYFKFWVRHSVEINRNAWLELGTNADWWQQVLVYMNTVFQFVGTSLIVVLFIWIFSTFTKKEYQRLSDLLRKLES